MPNRTPSESTEHKKLIRMMAKHFAKKGYTNIKADLQGYDNPNAVSGYIPDLTCNKNDNNRTRIILEAETCGTISSDHTDGQWKAFAEASGEFHLVVPKLCGSESGREKARRRLRQLGISAQKIWTPQ